MKTLSILLMNKLRKTSRPSQHALSTRDDAGNTVVTRDSRTMTLARAAASATVSATAVSVPLPKVYGTVKPVTPAEQYWAARALTAEALLSVKTSHHEDMKTAMVAEETKRVAEVAAVHQSHLHRQTKLELISIAMFAVLVALVAALLYMLHTSHNRPHQSRWLAPMHFTIPILSPFASVVEHESSLIGSKIIVASVLIAAILAYGCFRYWLTYRSKQ